MQPLEILSTGEELRFTTTDANVSALVPLTTLDLLAHNGTELAQNLVSNSLNQIARVRANLGALSNRLDHSFESAIGLKDNMAFAKSQLIDADFALESAKYARARILQETTTSLIAKSNELNELVLNLLRTE